MEILESLWRASWQGALAVAAVWLLCRVRRLPAAARCGLWWLVSLKLLVDLAGLPAVSLPLLPPAASDGLVPAAAAPPSAVTAAPAAPIAAPDSFLPSRPAAARFPWEAVLIGLWGLGIAVQGGWLVREHLHLCALRRRAAAVRDPEVLALFTDLVRRLGLRREPLLLESAEVASPQATGFAEPAILLPHAARDLPASDLEMALCHELAHLRRRDLWLGWVPAAAERLFFFHPLVGLAAREYALAREAACDAEVLDFLGAAPKAYGRLLLKLGVAPRAAVGAAAGAASSWIHLKRRLLMLQETTSAAAPRRSRAWLWLAAPVALLALIPLQLVRAQDPAAAPKSTLAAEMAEIGEPAERGQGTPVPEPGRAAEEEHPLLAGKKGWEMAGTPTAASYASNETSYVVTRGQDSSVMRGDMDDLRTARKLGKKWGGDVIWFERDGKAYAIRDAATVAKAHELFAPQTELGEQQGALGEQQGALGEQQGKLGVQQAKLGAQMATLAAEQAERAMKGEEGSEQAFESRVKELEENMEELGRQQEALGAKQEALGEKQEKLGEQQEKLAMEAEKKLDALIDEAVKKGLAEEVER